MKIYLTGFMGSGKSTYGSRLAKQLNCDFMDLDEKVEEDAGLSIPEIFKGQGEAHFRKLEHEALQETGALDDIVVATGGGTPCYYDNMQWMNANGLTVYLRMLDQELVKRLKKEKAQRPLLEGMKDNEIQQFVQEKMAKRAYYYHHSRIAIDPVAFKPGLLKQQLEKYSTQ